MRRYAIVFAIAFQFALKAEPKWLAVVSTSHSAEQAITSTKQLRTSSGEITVVVSDDCSNLKPGLFLSVAGVLNDRAAAQGKVSAIRNKVPDAYARACEPKPGSRVQFGINAVDASIFDVPSDVVNWDDKDRISEVRAAGPMYVWILRRYQKDKEDPREGRRTSVLLFKSDPSSARKLSPDCDDPQVVVADSLAALTCARETAGDNLMHQIQVLDIGSGRTIRTVDRCRNPKFVSSGEMTCESEDAGPDGVLKLTRKRLSLK